LCLDNYLVTAHLAILGLAIYHERVGNGGIRTAVQVLAALAAIWGIARLANSVIAELTPLAAAATPPAE
jgi:hypothetical protein